MTLSYHAGAELPTARLWLTTPDGNLVDLTAPTVTAIISRHGQILETITTGLTGAAGSGVEPSGTPNLTIAWSADDLDLPAGTYDLRIEARTGGLDYVWVIPLLIATSVPT